MASAGAGIAAKDDALIASLVGNKAPIAAATARGSDDDVARDDAALLGIMAGTQGTSSKLGPGKNAAASGVVASTTTALAAKDDAMLRGIMAASAGVGSTNTAAAPSGGGKEVAAALLRKALEPEGPASPAAKDDEALRGIMEEPQSTAAMDDAALRGIMATSQDAGGRGTTTGRHLQGGASAPSIKRPLQARPASVPLKGSQSLEGSHRRDHGHGEDRDDAALAFLLNNGAASGGGTGRATAQVGGSTPSRAPKPREAAVSVLQRIAELKAERARHAEEAAELEAALGGGRRSRLQGVPPPGALAAQGALAGQLVRVRRLRGIHVSLEELPAGSLWYYAAIGDATSVAYLCEQARRCDDRLLVNQVDAKGRTALHHAAHAADAKVAELLLDAGADVLLRDHDDRTALHLCAARGSLEVARAIIGVALRRLRAASLRRFRTAKVEIAADPDEPQKALQQAAYDALHEYLRSLEDLRYNLLLAEDRFNLTCLHYALRDAFYGCFPILQLLLGCLFEFGDAKRTDPVMSTRRFEPQPATSLVSTLSSFLLEHQASKLEREHVRRSLAIRDEMANHRDPPPIGLTPLHYAAAEGNYRAVPVLVACGAELNARAVVPGLGPDGVDGEDGESFTPFDLAKDMTTRQALFTLPLQGHRAVSVQAERMVGLVEGNCTSVNQERGLLGRTPLHLVLFRAIAAVDDDTVDFEGNESESALLAALLRAHPECDPLIPDANGWSPLHYACAHGRSKELRRLLLHAKQLHGGDLARAFSTGARNSGRAAQGVGNMRTREPAAAGAAVPAAGAGRSSSSSGGRPLRPAKEIAETGRLELARPDNRAHPRKAQVLARRARSAGFGGGTAGPQTPGEVGAPASASSGALMGRTLTHLAASGSSEGSKEAAAVLGSNGHIACLQILLEEGLLDVYTMDDRGLTPLLLASTAGATASMGWLLEQGADLYATDGTRRNALHIATTRGHRRSIRWLCHYDADTSRLKEGQDWKGRLPEELLRSGWARGPGRPDDFSEDFATLWEAARLGDLDQLQRALRAGTDLEALSPSGWTAAMYTAAFGNAALLRHLIALRCSCDPPPPAPTGLLRAAARPSKGRGPLHLAAEAGHAEICELLVTAGGATPDARDSAGRSAVVSACATGQLRTLQVLVACGADPLEAVTADAPGQNPFHMLSAGNSQKHAACLRWLAGIAVEKDPFKASDLLEEGELARPGGVARLQSATHLALQKAQREARARCDAEIVAAADGGLGGG